MSFVTWGANEPARISEVNALTECFDWLRLERVFTAESNTGALLRVLKPLFAGYEHKAGAELSETNRALIAEAVEALGKLTDDTTTTITSNAERDEMLRDALLQQAQDEAAQAA